MTEKRFTITQDFEEQYRQIRDNGHIIMGGFVEPQAEVIVNLLNKLNNENEQLKTYLEALREELSLADNENTVLIKENEQLKNSDTITDLETQIMKLKSKNKIIHEFESRYRERNLQLEKENKELKRTIREDYKKRKRVVNKYVDKIKEVEKENNELKQSTSSTLREFEKGIKKVQKLAKENEQLKSEIYDWKASAEDYHKLGKSLLKENNELKTVLKKTLKQLYNAQTSQIYEYSSNITEEEKQLKEHFKQKYSKYGWKE